jgi:hypothetical protein
MIASRIPESPLPFRTGNLTLANYRNPTKFTAPGLDVAIKSHFSSSGLQVNYE